jgi:polyhydroxyalkanoate synthesis regulator phasin
MPQRNEEKLSIKKDLVEFEDRIVHQFKIISEDLMQKIELVAEGVTNVNDNLGRVEQRLTEKIINVENDLASIIRVSYLDLSKRVDDLDRRVKELEKTISH